MFRADDKRGLPPAGSPLPPGTVAVPPPRLPGPPKRRPWLAFLSVSLLAAMVGLFLLWASRAELEEVTRGNGRVIPSSHVQVIQNLEGGILAELKVSEGQVVAKDQVLLRIDDTRFNSSYREARAKRLSLLGQHPVEDLDDGKRGVGRRLHHLAELLWAHHR